MPSAISSDAVSPRLRRVAFASLLACSLVVTANSATFAADPHPHHQHMMQPAAQIGDIRILAPFARATPAKVGGAFMTLQNAGGGADRLLKAESAIAESVELHTHVKDGDAMRMRPVDAIDVPAGGKAELAPGGHHVMLIGLRQPLKEGERFTLTLTFATAGRVDVEVPVMKMGAGAGSHRH